MPEEPSVNQAKFRALVSVPYRFKLFLLTRLPLAWVAGLRIIELTADNATVAVQYGYWTKNPFKSIYFAALAMAGELATGLLAYQHVYNRSPRISMLVTHMEASYKQKAVGRIQFRSVDGPAIASAIADSIASGEGREVVTTAIGTNQADEEVARLVVTWSFKVKSARK